MKVINKTSSNKEKTPQEIIAELQAKLEKQQQEILHKTQEIELLRHRLNVALNHRYGKRSEKISANQLSLFDEATQPTTEEAVAIEQAETEIAVATYTRKKPGRRALPKDLPRKQVIHDLTDAEKICPCGKPLHHFGEDKSEQLEFIPAQVRVIEHIRYKYACKQCEERGVKTAALPTQPIAKSIATPGLLSHVVVSKFADHLPLYRQEHILQRMGIDLPRATLCRWVLACGDLLKPLINELKSLILRDNYLQADETPVQVLNQTDRASTAKSYMWIYHAKAHRAILYDYSPTRAGTVPLQFLEKFSGILQTDGYEGYKSVCLKNQLIHAGCFGHVRRKFTDIIKTTKGEGRAHHAINLIRKLYAIEREAAILHLSAEQRRALRIEKAQPIMQEFNEWLIKTSNQVPPQSPIGQAIQYTLNQWHKLIVYLEHGDLEIDNNLIENFIRPFAIGRKNWLFMGNERGAIAAAAIYSLMANCKLLQIEPYAYFKFIFDRLPKCSSAEDYQKLLPQVVDVAALARAYSIVGWD
jgi:transposase